MIQRSGRVERICWTCGLIAVGLIGAGFFAIDEGGTTDAMDDTINTQYQRFTRLPSIHR